MAVITGFKSLGPVMAILAFDEDVKLRLRLINPEASCILIS
ncbi:MAG: hypothetical protein ACYC2T_00470 [Bacillota bacterium]